MKNLTQIKCALILVLTSTLLLNCKSDENNNSETSDELSIENIIGTWIINSASLNIIEQDNGTIATIDPDTSMEGQVVTFTQTEIIIEDNGEENNLPYTLSTSLQTFSVMVEEEEFDVFDIMSFNSESMIMVNVAPQESDFKYDEEYDAVIYEQRTLTFIKQ